VKLDPVQIVMEILALAIAIPVHEFAHAMSAVRAGDDGPRRAGRLSILPWDHFDPAGAFFCVMTSITGFGLGWGRPVMVNPSMLGNPRRDLPMIAAWGPISNFLLAVLFAMPIRFGWVPPSDGVAAFLSICLMVNLSLMLFNLIPVGPLDGAKVIVAFLPWKTAQEYERFMGTWGAVILLGLMLAGGPVLSLLVGRPARQIALWLIGA
jgi:Zn-dependent protease